MAKAQLAPLLEQRGNESDKQFLVELKKNGHIAKQELRVLARELDESGDLEGVLTAFDEGEIEIPAGKAGSRGFVTLADVPDTASAKEMIAWLFRKEAITKGQARKAAQIIDSTKVRPSDDREFVSAVLRRVGAYSVLQEEPPEPVEGEGTEEADEEPPEGGQEPPQGAETPEGGVETSPQPEGTEEGQEGGEDDEEEDEPQWPGSAGPMTPARLYGMNAIDTRAYITKVEDPLALDQIHAWERAHPEYSGGRTTVLDAVEERRGELEVDDPNEG